MDLEVGKCAVYICKDSRRDEIVAQVHHPGQIREWYDFRHPRTRIIRKRAAGTKSL